MSFLSRKLSRHPFRHRRLPVSVETMEGRTLLSTVPLTASLPPQPIASELSLAASQGQMERNATQLPASANPPQTSTPGLDQQGKFLVHTFGKGWTITHSHQVTSAGTSLAELTFSHNTRKVALAYLRAIIRGNGKTFNELGHTKLVNQVGHEFTNLGNAASVKRLTSTLDKFGHSVSREAKRLF